MSMFPAFAVHTFSACIGQAAVCVSRSLSTRIPPLYNGTPPSRSTLASHNPHIHVVPTLIFIHFSALRKGQDRGRSLPYHSCSMRQCGCWHGAHCFIKSVERPPVRSGDKSRCQDVNFHPVITAPTHSPCSSPAVLLAVLKHKMHALASERTCP